MKRYFLAAGMMGIMAVLFAASASLPKTQHNSQSCKPNINQGFSSIAESALQAVANITTIQIFKNSKDCEPRDSLHHSAFDDEEFPSDLNELPSHPYEVQSSGSGFVIQSGPNAAFIVTNYHVIANADKVSVFLNDHTEREATVLGVDTGADLAVLKVTTTNHLPTLEWGDSHAAKVGDFVLAIGNSLGLGSSVSHGIISHLSRRIERARPTYAYTPDFIQHSAPIHRGNSGGPLLNLEGKVIGINTAIFSPSGDNVGIGFAISSAIAKERIKQLIEFGRIRYGWLGIKTQTISGDEFGDLDLEKGNNYKIVSSVTPFGPGAKAMIKPGDVILEFDGKEVTEKTNFTQLIHETPVGKSVKIKLYRLGQSLTDQKCSGQTVTVEATVEEANENSSLSFC